MPIKLNFFWFLLALLGSKYSQAQQTNNNGLTAKVDKIDNQTSPTEIDWANFELAMEENPETWTFKISEQQKNLMIDFEQLAGIPQKMWLLSEQDEPVFEDSHLDGLNKNTIYEVSLSQLPTGSYTLEIENEMGELLRHNFMWAGK